ncbi:uncharacterized protein LOC131072549 [Cryptomeria japonica]|uniref:uncharacterized protein LOC131072549 n=1 Tax=Cryptomeria japonica TaxID=3369 RepID=UPI0027DA599D|nr:uncharacterized protein LOC131072549 [Cryptomeria japonica]
MYGDLDLNDTDKDHSDRKSSAKRFRCRFCNRSFSKSQALGGHMNGHRQERDDEKYSKAKVLMEQKYGSSLLNMRMPGQSIQSNNYVAPQSYSAIPGGVQAHSELFSPSQVQIGCSTSIPTYSNQNVGGGISRVGPSLNQKGQQQKQQQVFDQKVAGQYRNSPPIPSHPNCHSPSQNQIGPSTSVPTYSNQNLGGGISRVGPSLNQKVQLQQQQQQQVFDQKLADQYRNSHSIPSYLNCQIRGGASHPYLPYQTSMDNNLQIGGEPLLNNLGARGASLPINSNLQIKEPSLPTLQGRDPNFVVNGQAAPQPSEQQQQFFNVLPSPLSSWKVENPSL